MATTTTTPTNAAPQANWPASWRKTGRMGAVVTILGENWTQCGYTDEASALVEKVNARCAGMTADEIRTLYKLGRS